MYRFSLSLLCIFWLSAGCNSLQLSHQNILWLSLAGKVTPEASHDAHQHDRLCGHARTRVKIYRPAATKAELSSCPLLNVTASQTNNKAAASGNCLISQQNVWVYYYNDRWEYYDKTLGKWYEMAVD